MLIGKQYRCPVPGCAHAASEITTIHYEGIHEITKRAAQEAHGKPVAVKYNGQRAKENLISYVKPPKVNNAYISDTDFARERRQGRRGRG